ncbi:MAG: GIY-YIG nuclease family protein [Nitrospira sp. CG24A]|nr:MAG: GIY-YIG nuclease family protein [Nitrospira sp. CG24A]
MPVYFVIDRSSSQIKIGRSKDVPKRVRTLQTGNPNPLELMGWVLSGHDTSTERTLHKRYGAKRGSGEWFSITQDEVLWELKRACGFIPKKGDAFEIVGYDRDGVPEYLGVCDWADFELEECCPFCGCFCGMHFQEASAMYHCLNCDALTDFSGLSRGKNEV